MCSGRDEKVLKPNLKAIVERSDPAGKLQDQVNHTHTYRKPCEEVDKYP